MNAHAWRDAGPVPELDPGTIVRVLNKQGVRYVVIGGLAAEIHDLPVPATVDIVFTPDGAPSGYADLASDSVRAELEDQPVMVITVAKWEALKKATGRAKDLEHLDLYYETRGEE